MHLLITDGEKIITDEEVRNFVAISMEKEDDGISVSSTMNIYEMTVPQYTTALAAQIASSLMDLGDTKTEAAATVLLAARTMQAYLSKHIPARVLQKAKLLADAAAMLRDINVTQIRDETAEAAEDMP